MNKLQRLARIPFNVAARLGVTYTVTYKSVTDNGIDDPVIVQKTIKKVVRESFTQDDIRGLIFRDKIQPTDIKLLVLGEQIGSIKINTSDVFIIEDIEYTVFGCQLDPASAVWTIGVR